MKRIVSVLAVLVMALGLMCGCAKDDTAKTDSEYVRDKGTLVVGITNFAPMDYKDENGEWIGLTLTWQKRLLRVWALKAEFKVIDWNYKINELNDKGIDCVWNGMTIGDEVLAGMEVSNAYCKNAGLLY